MFASPTFNELEISFLELSKNRHLETEDVKQLKLLWANYFMEKSRKEADKVWQEKGYSNIDVDKWTEGK